MGLDLFNQGNSQFERAYAMLNAKQKEGVDHIDGPVMIIAGPGTGKTQLLGVRIGHILKQTDAQAHNILCLTYTEAGMVAMRKRLLKFIGPEAYNVNIFTYHAFCNKIIQENVEYFGGYRELQLITDLEVLEVLKEIVDDFPDDHILKRWKGNVYYERKSLKDLFATMKQESWSAEYVEQSVNKYLQDNLDAGVYDYKRKYTNKKTGEVFMKGDLNAKKYDADVKKYEKLKVASKELKNYRRKLEERQRFDYNDMITWVNTAFAEHDDLLARYQEQFQYILVDEYQDTNGSQNDLIFHLADYWEQPNLFVVGDDDQAIYRFQGANMENLLEFRSKFSPTEIVLGDNYRSSQKVLDDSMQLINHNANRLSIKELKEQRQDQSKQVAPKIISYHNEIHESKHIADQIVALHRQGVALKEIAVIGRKHANFADLIKYLELQGIAIKAKRPVDVLKLPEVLRLRKLLNYLKDELIKAHSGQLELFQIMHFEYFDIHPLDIARLSIFCSTKNEDGFYEYKWREVINDEVTLAKIELRHPDKILEFSDLIERWIKTWVNATPQVLFEQILTYGNVIDTIMASADRSSRLQALNTFFDFIKSETARSRSVNMTDILDMLDEMDDNSIPLNYNSITYAEDGVNFLTAHGCKGLEFEHVFMIRCDEKNWDSGKRRMGYSFPSSLTASASLTEIEDDRRLFYVAMTRAKNHLNISYPQHIGEGKELNACRFIHEIADESRIQEIAVDDEHILVYQSTLLRDHQGKVELLDHSLIDQQLERFSMSVTNLNKYLRCPLTFYFETILRVPMARNANMGFGSAIHYALEQLFIKIKREGVVSANMDFLAESFKKGMDQYHSHFTPKQFDDLLTYGKQTLNGYFDTYQHEWSDEIEYHLEYPVKDVEYKGIPINGKIDKIELKKTTADVVDFKTGQYKSDSMKPVLGDDDNGGDYWRQLVFYKMLIDSDPRISWIYGSGTMDFVEKDKKTDTYNRKTLEIGSLDVDLVYDQLKTSYDKILNHEFEQGCGEDNCKWCNFVKNNFKIDPELESYVDEVE